jgi:very-short-patch-repair endonuclease
VNGRFSTGRDERRHGSAHNSNIETMSITLDISSQGGLAPTHRLLRRGWTRHSLSGAVRSGVIIRVRQGWYALPDEKETRLQASRVGGLLTCSIGAQEWGLWTRTRTPALHVAVPAHAARLRDPHNHRTLRSPATAPTIHWVDHLRGTAFIADPLSCLLAMTRCEPLESVVAAVDCALGIRMITVRQWRRAAAGLPARMRLQLLDVDAGSGSYWESVVRFRLHRRGIVLQTQVEFCPGLRVDFLIGKHLVVEIDGLQHATPEQYALDRKRDAQLSILGCRCLRFTARQVRSNWPMVRKAIEAAIARGDAD